MLSCLGHAVFSTMLIVTTCLMQVLFSDQEVAIFFAKTTLMGLAIGAISSYLFMYLSLLGKCGTSLEVFPFTYIHI